MTGIDCGFWWVLWAEEKAAEQTSVFQMAVGFCGWSAMASLVLNELINKKIFLPIWELKEGGL